MNWDQTVDVLVVGSGNGGMTAAVCCHEMGAKNVLLIEKGEKYGGTSSYSGGGIWVPCSHYTIEAGAEDSLAEARDYLSHAIPAGSVDPEAPIAPGMIESHYAPRAQLRLAVDHVNPGEALLAFGIKLPVSTQDAALVLNLSPAGDLVEAATNLFSDLRTLDQSGVDTIAVMPVPNEGLGEAINDRLARAAAPRESKSAK